MKPSRLVLLLLLVPVLLPAADRLQAAAPRPAETRWKKSVLDRKFRAEGAAVADVNRDGRPDILAGNFWYAAPAWTPREIRPPQEFEPATGYSNCFLTFAYDIDGDRWPDQIVIGFPGAKAAWLRNPGRTGGAWTEHPITESACNESPIFADLWGDRTPELVTPFQEARMAFYSLAGGGSRPGSAGARDPLTGHSAHAGEPIHDRALLFSLPERTTGERFVQHLVGEPKAPGCNRFSHGLGVGDVNGDRRPDILCTEGYYQAPPGEEPGVWKFVPAKLGPACAQMYTHDFDGDGDMDVISSSAHAIGVWWHEQVPGPTGPEFRQHVIDNSFSQSHSLMMADLNGDRQPDFVTGKRWWAHGPNGDVNPNHPAVLYWFEFRRRNGKVEWTRHPIDEDSGVGTQFTIADVNKDRRPDIVTSNKKGVFYFEQQR